MSKAVLLNLGQKMVGMFWQSCEVKRFVVHLLERYAASTDNNVDNFAVDMIREKLLVNCPEK